MKNQTLYILGYPHKTTVKFTYSGDTLEIISGYKYLGLYLDEFLNFDEAVSMLAGAGGRALGSVISKTKHLNYCGYKTYSKLFYNCVSPILDYCSGVWGYANKDKIKTTK